MLHKIPLVDTDTFHETQKQTNKKQQQQGRKRKIILEEDHDAAPIINHIWTSIVKLKKCKNYPLKKRWEFWHKWGIIGLFG